MQMDYGNTAIDILDITTWGANIMDAGEKYEKIVLRLLTEKMEEWLREDPKRTKTELGKKIYPHKSDGPRKIRFWTNPGSSRKDALRMRDVFLICQFMAIDMANLQVLAKYFYDQEQQGKVLQLVKPAEGDGT